MVKRNTSTTDNKKTPTKQFEVTEELQRLGFTEIGFIHDRQEGWKIELKYSFIDDSKGYSEPREIIVIANYFDASVTKTTEAIDVEFSKYPREITQQVRASFRIKFSDIFLEQTEKSKGQMNADEEGQEEGQDMDQKIVEHAAYKYSMGMSYLHEQVLLGNQSVFLHLEQEDNFKKKKPVLTNMIDLSEEKGIQIFPHEHGPKSPTFPYQFKDVKEIYRYIKLAEKQTIDSLYFMSKSLWKKFVVADNEQLILLTADSIFTYFQDLFASTHYVHVVGSAGSGKGAMLVGFKYLAYRVVLAADMSGANILDLLGSLEDGQVVIVEDELDDIDKDPDKKRLIKVGYDRHGSVTRTLDGNTKGRQLKWFCTYGYKLFASENSSDSSKMEGFNDRTFQMRSIKGKPEFYVKELITPKDSERVRDIIAKVEHFRKLMMMYRLLHFKDKIKDVKTNLDGRPLELTGSEICLFSAATMTKDKSALQEVLPVLSSFLRQKGELAGRTIEAVIYKVITEMIDDPQAAPECREEIRLDGNTHHCYEISTTDIYEKVKDVVGGESIPNKTQTFYSPEFDKVSNHAILRRCRDRLTGIDVTIGRGKDKVRGLKFSREELEKAGQVYRVIKEIEILPDNPEDDQLKPETADEREIWRSWHEFQDREDTTDEYDGTDTDDEDGEDGNDADAGDNNASSNCNDNDNEVGTNMGTIFYPTTRIVPTTNSESGDIVNTNTKQESDNIYNNIGDKDINLTSQDSGKPDKWGQLLPCGEMGSNIDTISQQPETPDITNNVDNLTNNAKNVAKSQQNEHNDANIILETQQAKDPKNHAKNDTPFPSRPKIVPIFQSQSSTEELECESEADRERKRIEVFWQSFEDLERDANAKYVTAADKDTVQGTRLKQLMVQKSNNECTGCFHNVGEAEYYLGQMVKRNLVKQVVYDTYRRVIKKKV